MTRSERARAPEGEGPWARRWRGTTLGRAAVELTVVILGVWIALWADGWAADRRDRQDEAARLRALRQEVVVVAGEIREARAEAGEAERTLRRLATVEATSWGEPEYRKSLLSGLFYGPSYWPVLSVYDDLRNSGELSLLTDADVRADLSAVGAEIERLEMQMADLTTVQQLNVDAYLIRTLDLSLILAEYLELPAPDAPEVPIRRDDLALRNLIIFKLDLLKQLGQGFDHLVERLEGLLGSIEAALA